LRKIDRFDPRHQCNLWFKKLCGLIRLPFGFAQGLDPSTRLGIPEPVEREPVETAAVPRQVFRGSKCMASTEVGRPTRKPVPFAKNMRRMIHHAPSPHAFMSAQRFAMRPKIHRPTAAATPINAKGIQT
jgi:hypothetical protein